MEFCLERQNHTERHTVAFDQCQGELWMAFPALCLHELTIRVDVKFWQEFDMRSYKVKVCNRVAIYPEP